MIKKLLLLTSALYMAIGAMSQTKGSAVRPADEGYIDVTEDYLIESSSFSRDASDPNLRFGKSAYWTVENYGISNGGSGVKNGLDNYTGANSLQLGAWEESPNNAALKNSRLYRTVTLSAGKYYFGAKYESIEPDKYTSANKGYLFVADKVMDTDAVEAEAMAYCTLSSSKNDGRFHGVEFTLDAEQEICLGWQVDSRFWHSEFRATDVMLLKYEELAFTSLFDFVSPNNKLKVELSQTSQQTYLTLTTASGEFVTKTPLGLNSNTDNLWKQLEFTGASTPELKKVEYANIHGKRSLAQNEANFVTAHFKNAAGTAFDIEVCAYNDGLAFRYLITDETKVTRTFTDEVTCYEIAPEVHRWLQPYTTSYESDFPYQESAGSTGAWGYPCLFELKDGTFALITEANTNGMYCATHLENNNSENKYKLTYPYSWEGYGVGESNPTWTGKWNSPWRVIIVGELKDIVESTLVEDVCDPCKLENTDFIQPGSAAWVYWAYNHGTQDYQICKQYVDLAANMGWDYVLFDWEWEQMGNGGNLEDAVRYAKSKGVKPMIWYHSNDSKMQNSASRKQEMTWLRNIGVTGIKVDFFESDKQHTMQYFIDILEDAAQYGIMVNFHGCTATRGLSRTYPNLMSMEAVHGGEQYNNAGYMTTEGPRINCMLVYTRNVVGPMDYTPVAFTDSQHPHTTTFAHELALSVAFESGIQHWADRPEGFYALPDMARKHMEDVPVAWDDTRFVGGYPGKSFIVARRNGDVWYIAGLQGENGATTFDVTFDFLSEGTYNAVLIGDGAEDRKFSFASMEVKKGDKLPINCLGRGGFVLTLTPADYTGDTSLQQLADLQAEVVEAIAQTEGKIGINTGFYSKDAVEAIEAALAESRKVNESSSAAQIYAAYQKLFVAYSEFKVNGLEAGGKWMNLEGWVDVTETYLVEKRNFSREDESTSPTTRFGLLAEPWIVTENIINQDNYTHGGFDSFDNGRAISIEKWSGGEAAMVNDKIYQTTKAPVPAGKYHLRFVLTARFGLDGESCLLRVAKGEDFPGVGEEDGKILSTFNMNATDYSGTYNVCDFELTEAQTLSIGWVLNLPQESKEHAFRVTSIRLIDESGKDVSANYLGNYQNIQRKDRSYRRFGIPTYWDVAEFEIENGNEGVKQGIDSYPGYNCLMLGVWDDQFYSFGKLADTRIYRQVALPVGKYFFGAAYNAIYNTAKTYMFAAPTPVTAAQTEKQAIAFYSLENTPESDDLYGLTFELKESTTLYLGWNSDLTTHNQKEFRAKTIGLYRYADPTGITEIPAADGVAEGPITVYDLQGRVCPGLDSAKPGIYLVKQGRTVKKVLVK